MADCFFCINVDHVDTNIVIMDISNRAIDASNIIRSLKERGILITPGGKTKVRMVTHLDISDEDIEYTLNVVRDLYQ